MQVVALENIRQFQVMLVRSLYFEAAGIKAMSKLFTTCTSSLLSLMTCWIMSDAELLVTLTCYY